ncbi:cysteine desulfurase family protein, partial [Chloroflexota bacterium]
MRNIYLDYNATTPIDTRVLDSMLPYLREEYGNPSSGHLLGQRAKVAIDGSRSQVASLIGCESEEVVFTSGGSESNNLAIKGVTSGAKLLGLHGNHIITSSIEHPSVSKTLQSLKKQGFSITTVPVDNLGLIDPTKVAEAITPGTILITIMHANNEVGTIQPITEIAELARNQRILFHTDAAQSAGKIPATVNDLGVDLLTIAGHKLYSPKGVGALFIRQDTLLEPLIHGAGHESGRRAGTENVAGIVGLGTACAIATKELDVYQSNILSLRERLHHGVLSLTPHAVLNGHLQRRLPNTLNISFRGYDGSNLLERLENISASTGAAC